jgi:hypothetical protein
LVISPTYLIKRRPNKLHLQNPKLLSVSIQNS